MIHHLSMVHGPYYDPEPHMFTYEEKEEIDEVK